MGQGTSNHVGPHAVLGSEEAVKCAEEITGICRHRLLTSATPLCEDRRSGPSATLSQPGPGVSAGGLGWALNRFDSAKT